MDVEHLKHKLHPELKKEPTIKEKLHKHRLAIEVGFGFLAIVLLIASFAIIQAPKKIEGMPQACFKHDVCINLILVTTQIEQEIGLGNYSSLPDNTGMLFIFTDDAKHEMWMKDMKFRIDMIWIGKDDRIKHMEKDAYPCTPPLCDILSSDEPTRYVLETRAGFVKDTNLFENDEVTFKNLP